MLKPFYAFSIEFCLICKMNWKLIKWLDIFNKPTIDIFIMNEEEEFPRPFDKEPER